jgi:hypothetical protein
MGQLYGRNGVLMRSLAPILIIAATASSAMAEPRELISADNAIFCLNPSNLDKAHRPLNSQQQLRGLQCMRTESGIPLTVLDADELSGPWQVLLRPQGISQGVTMWALPSSFKAQDGSHILLRSKWSDK